MYLFIHLFDIRVVILYLYLYINILTFFFFFFEVYISIYFPLSKLQMIDVSFFFITCVYLMLWSPCVSSYVCVCVCVCVCVFSCVFYWSCALKSLVWLTVCFIFYYFSSFVLLRLFWFIFNYVLFVIVYVLCSFFFLLFYSSIEN